VFDRQQKSVGKQAGKAGFTLREVANPIAGGLFRVFSKVPAFVRRLGGVSGLVLLLVILAAVGGFIFAGHGFFFRPCTIRDRVGVGALDETIYIFGGTRPDVGVLRDVLAFDVRRRRVSPVGELPWPAHCAMIAAADGALYVMDGRSGSTAIPEIVRFDPTNRSIEPVGRMPESRSFGAVTSDGETIYYVGGWDGAAVRDEVLAFSPGAWEARIVARLPVPVRNCAAVCSSGRLYVLGGETGEGDLLSLLVEVDIESGRVLRTFELPTPISRTTIVEFADYLYVFGGWNREALGDIARISIGEGPMVHEIVGQLPAPSSECTALIANQRIVVVGGESVYDGRELRISEFDPVELAFRVLRFRGSI